MAATVASSTLVSVDAGNVTATRPTGTADGDLLVAYLVKDKDTAATQGTAPAGWTQSGTTFSGNNHVKVFYKYAASEPASWTFTGTGGSSMQVAVLRITGSLTTGDPFDVGPTSGNSASSSIVAASVSPTGSDSLLLLGVSYYANSPARTYTYPAGMTKEKDGAPPGGYISAAIGYQALTASGATGTRTVTASNTGTFTYTAAAIKSGSVPDTTSTTRVGGSAWGGLKAASAASVLALAATGALTWSGVAASSTAVPAATDTTHPGSLSWSGTRATSVGDSVTPAGLGGLSWSGVDAGSTAAAAGTVSHIFTTQTPTTSAGDAQVTVGVAFTVDTPGSATGARVHTGGSTGYQSKTISAGLWDAAGTLLATGSATTAADQGNDWFDIPFDTAAALTTGQTYTVGINTGAGSGYAYTASGLSAAIDNPPLHTPATAGRFDYGALGKPGTATGTNFFADITYVAAAGGDTTDTTRVGALSWSGVRATSTAIGDTTDAAHTAGGLAWSGLRAQSAADTVHAARVGSLALGGVAPVLSFEDVVRGTGPGAVAWAGVRASSTALGGGVAHSAKLGALGFGGVKASSTSSTIATGTVAGVTWSGVRATSAGDATSPTRLGFVGWSGVAASSTIAVIQNEAARVGSWSWAGVSAVSATDVRTGATGGFLAWAGVPATSRATGPNLRDLDLVATVHPDRYTATLHGDRYAAATHPDRYRSST